MAQFFDHTKPNTTTTFHHKINKRNEFGQKTVHHDAMTREKMVMDGASSSAPAPAAAAARLKTICFGSSTRPLWVLAQCEIEPTSRVPFGYALWWRELISTDSRGEPRYRAFPFGWSAASAAMGH